MGVGPHVMVLGPSSDHRKDDWPLRLRRDVAKLLRARRCGAVIMEDAESQPGESLARKFHRLVEEYNVRTFLVVWPKACRLHGLDVELGFLLDRIIAGALEARDVKLVTHEGNIAMGADGKWSVGEPGNRTRYYDSLLDEGCPILMFASASHLNLNVLSAAVDHQQRHILRVDERDFVGQAAKNLKAKTSKAKPS